jgi:hypothetical protein
VHCSKLYHWQPEIEICKHIMEKHEDAMEEVQTWIAERTNEKDDKDELLIMKMAPRWHLKKTKTRTLKKNKKIFFEKCQKVNRCF